MNHGRATALHPDLIAHLRGWQAIQNPASRYVFADVRQGLPITAERVGKIVRQIKVATGLSHLHTHRLRHELCHLDTQESKDLYAVSKALGHAELAQTEVYIAAAPGVSQIAAAVGQLPGIEDW